MAVLRVKNTGNGTDGSSWANAYQTVAAADAAPDAAGDEIVASSAHTETSGTNITWAFAGTAASPTKLLSVNDAADPPTALAAGATVATSTSITITATAAALYVYGFNLHCGGGGSSSNINIGTTTGAMHRWEACNFRQGSTGTSGRAWVGTSAGGAGGHVEMRDCTFRFLAASQAAGIRNCTFVGYNIGLDMGAVGGLGSAVSPTTFFTQIGVQNTGKGADVQIFGLDLSAGAAGINIVGTVDSGSHVQFYNVKVPSSWSGALVQSTIDPGGRVEAYNIDSGDTNYRFLVADFCGTIREETTIVRTGGAGDGVTSYSHCMASNGNAQYPVGALRSLPLVVKNSATGSAKTITVEVVTDGVTLTDAEIGLEVVALTNSGSTLSSYANDLKANWYTGAQNQDSSSVSWTTTGLASPVKQKLSVQVTPQEAGPIFVRVMLMRQNTTVYIDPNPTIA